jgi:hypothetical protein
MKKLSKEIAAKSLTDEQFFYWRIELFTTGLKIWLHTVRKKSKENVLLKKRTIFLVKQGKLKVGVVPADRLIA